MYFIAFVEASLSLAFLINSLLYENAFLLLLYTYNA